MIATQSELVIDDEAREMMTGTLRIFAYEAIDAMNCVSEKCGIPLSKILVYVRQYPDLPGHRFLKLIACFDADSSYSRLLWDTFTGALDSWIATKSAEDIDFISDNLSTTFRWEN